MSALEALVLAGNELNAFSVFVFKKRATLAILSLGSSKHSGRKALLLSFPTSTRRRVRSLRRRRAEMERNSCPEGQKRVKKSVEKKLKKVEEKSKKSRRKVEEKPKKSRNS
jgi:hypothetical protein